MLSVQILRTCACEFSRQSVPMEPLLRSNQRTFPESSWGTFAINVTPTPEVTTALTCPHRSVLPDCGLLNAHMASFGWIFSPVLAGHGLHSHGGPAPVGIRKRLIYFLLLQN